MDNHRARERTDTGSKWLEKGARLSRKKVEEDG